MKTTTRARASARPPCSCAVRTHPRAPPSRPGARGAPPDRARGALVVCERPPFSISEENRQPRKRNGFFVIAFPPGTIYGGSCGIALNSTTRRHPRLGLVSALVAGSRGPAQIHIRGLCHWAGEPAGHLGAESPSRRTARPASARKTSPPCPHWLRGLSQAHHVNAVSRHRRVPPFASSRRPLTHALAHLQWQSKSHPGLQTQAQPAGHQLKSHRPRAVRPPDRYGRVRAIRDSPSDVAACHRVVRRHTCCSPATRRSMRATQARAAPGVNVDQPAPKAASKLSHEARRSSEECVGSHESHRPNYESPRFAMVRKFSFSFCLVLVILSFWLAISEPGWTSRKKVPLGVRLKSTETERNPQLPPLKVSLRRRKVSVSWAVKIGCWEIHRALWKKNVRGF